MHEDFGTVWQGAPNGIPYCIVRGDQPKVPVTFRYADESDPGPYPLPPDAPIEGLASDGDLVLLTCRIMDLSAFHPYLRTILPTLNAHVSWCIEIVGLLLVLAEILPLFTNTYL